MRRHAAALASVAALCVLAYLPLFRQPLMQDDWPNIDLARHWVEMLSNPVFRYRTLHWMMTRSIDVLFGVRPPAFYAVSIALHIGASWLVYAFGSLPPIGWRVSFAAAAFFAVYEGHQEAVMWYSASAETLMFLFGAGAVLCWAQGRAVPAFALFLAALATKESAVIFAPLMLLFDRRWKRWLPFAAAAAAYAGAIAAGRSYSFRFQDGSFSLQAPFWITWPASYARLLWIWGLLALIVHAAHRKWPQAARLGLLWMAMGLAPYVWLTYMHRVPSRQVYIASAGLALVAGSAFVSLPRRAMPLVATVVIVANAGYLWTKKRAQFLERAAPSEAVIAIARRSSGPVYVRCYPGPFLVPEAAVRLATGKQAIAEPRPGATDFCWK